MAEGAMEITWNAFIEDLEEISAADCSITGMNAAGVINIFKLVVNSRENYKPSHWFYLQYQRQEENQPKPKRSEQGDNEITRKTVNWTEQ